MKEYIIEREKWDIATSLGKMQLGNLTLLDDCLNMFFDINKVTDNLQVEINRRIDDSAKSTYEANKKLCEEYGITSMDDINIDDIQMKEVFKSLNVDLVDGKVKTYISVGANDEKSGRLDVDISIPVDISPIFAEMKNIILNAMEQIYFGEYIGSGCA